MNLKFLSNIFRRNTEREPSSTLERALGVAGAEAFIRDMKEAQRVERSGNTDGGQLLAKEAIRKSEIAMQTESMRLKKQYSGGGC